MDLIDISGNLTHLQPTWTKIGWGSNRTRCDFSVLPLDTVLYYSMLWYELDTKRNSSALILFTFVFHVILCLNIRLVTWSGKANVFNFAKFDNEEYWVKVAFYWSHITIILAYISSMFKENVRNINNGMSKHSMF